MTKKQKYKSKGLTMIEVLVGIFLLAILSLGIYASYAFGLKMSVHNRLRTEAVAIGEKKIETIRAMDYEDIGTQGGIPSGQLLANETVNSNGANYSVRTSVRYIDDPLDDKFPSDTAPTDYKQIEVRVDWPTNLENKMIILNTYVAPPRVETNVGMGVLMINTVDSTGNPLSNCHVHIVNSEVNPPINITEDTDNDGSLTLPGAPTTETNSYEISVSKDGYESVQTYPPFPDSAFNPIDAHIAVSQGSITSKVFVIDLLSHQNLHFKDTFGNNLPDMAFSLAGGRVIGTTIEAAPAPVYAYNEPALICGNDGEWESPEIGMGPYFFSITNASYELITTSLSSPWSIAPNSTTTIDITMGSKTENILVVAVKETGGETPIVGATVRITDSVNTLFQESVSDINGIAYFPLVADPPKVFTLGENYNIDVTKEGYLPGHDLTLISGITRKEIILTQQN